MQGDERRLVTKMWGSKTITFKIIFHFTIYSKSNKSQRKELYSVGIDLTYIISLFRLSSNTFEISLFISEIHWQIQQNVCKWYNEIIVLILHFSYLRMCDKEILHTTRNANNSVFILTCFNWNLFRNILGNDLMHLDHLSSFTCLKSLNCGHVRALPRRVLAEQINPNTFSFFFAT